MTRSAHLVDAIAAITIAVSATPASVRIIAIVARLAILGQGNAFTPFASIARGAFTMRCAFLG